ncbi:hypothetical protein BDEG_23814 [Batrachochytrium dendrobatidis JEL423]|uniref:Uncharacterized protein n=1 Tax=Batrachochytrium dendrobatidis (strain JEL423) TaxID=403673 RepID=A0A177WJS4_BATDL|nr:hypothetical protein BDEG_23814 [Batrachochytrium dendrobatidis JEL423]
MSAEVSTPTASTSGGSAGGPDSPEFFNPEDFEKYCYPFGITQVSYIDKIAQGQIKINGIFEKSSSKRHELDLQKKLLEELEQQFETLSQTPDDGLDTVQFELETEREALAKLEEELQKLSDEAMVLIGKNMGYKKTLRGHLGMVPSEEGEVPKLGDYPGYTECYEYLFAVFSQ